MLHLDYPLTVRACGIKTFQQPLRVQTAAGALLGKDLAVVGAKDAWIERTGFVLDDLEFLCVK